MYRLVCVLVCAFLSFSLVGCRSQVLYSGLSQREANEMLAVLEAAGFSGSTSSEGTTGKLSVTVAQSDVGSAARVLARSGLPRDKRASITDILPKESYLASPSDDRARLAYGMSQELTSTLMQISGVAQVRVHLALAEKNVLGQITSPPSASVLIRHNPDILRGDFQDSVRSIVASSVTGLTYDRVSVTMIPEESMPSLNRGTDKPASAAAAQSAAQAGNQAGFGGIGDGASPNPVMAALGNLGSAGPFLALGVGVVVSALLLGLFRLVGARIR
jgi:type III secretion protein J